jgi:ADP-ribose pyrophosphatase YjhB (NUDIX family)
MSPRVEKALAYITQGEHVLLVRHPAHPEAGIQIPGGSVHANELPAEAALREAREETGLADLSVVQLLGVAEFDMAPFGKAEVHTRHYFHLRFRGQSPESWRHEERDPSDGSKEPIPLELFWARFPSDVPPLIAGHGQFLRAAFMPSIPALQQPPPSRRG